MATERPSLDSIFCTAIELASPEERAAHLDAVCGDDHELRRQVQILVVAHFEAGSFLENPAVAPESTAAYTLDLPTDANASIEVGTVLGPYRLLQQIGEGGMGAVFLAEQTEPIRRQVALKVVKPGMDSRPVIARFEAERQALALMDHPNISKVLEAGTTPDGRPYFVMELVAGLPITKFCAEHHLPLKARLSLFIAVCQAVQHAHQKSIIHRDLKPTNILVTLVDGQPVPKVIDFGIAKAIGPELTDQAEFTAFGSILGTLEYMSPEQAAAGGIDVDTRADIYALGVLLYELLTGTTPLEKERLKAAALLDVLRRIREEEPPRPSVRLGALGGPVRGDLDWVTMKCLEKDRSRRYESAGGLTLDIERFLKDEPVLASPPSAWYRFRKFARRNVAALLAGSALLAALLVSVVVFAVSNVLIRTESEAKLAAEKQRTNEANKRVEAEKKEVEALGGWRQTAHYLRLGVVLNEHRANRVKQAEDLLDSCEPDLRAWEWHYLKRLCRGALRTANVGRQNHYVTAFRPDGQQLAMFDLLGKEVPVLRETATGKETRKFPEPEQHLRSVVFSADGKYLAFGGSRAAQDLVTVWDTATGQELATLTGERTPPGNRREGFPDDAFSPDGARLARVDDRGTLFCWDRATGEELFRVVANAAPNKPGRGISRTCVGFNEAGQILTVNPDETVIKVWAGYSDDLVRSVGPITGHYRMCFSPKGTWLATAGSISSRQPDLTIRLWDTKTGRTRHVFPGHSRPMECMAFSADEKLLATGSWDNSVTVWDVQTGLEIATHRAGRSIDLTGPGSGIVQVGFTADGKQVVAVSGDGAVRTWDAMRSSEALTLQGRSIPPATFSPDSRYVAGYGSRGIGGTGDPRDPWNRVGMIFIWDTVTGEEVQATREEEFGTPQEQVIFSPDGRFLVAGTVDELLDANDRLIRKIYRVCFWDAMTGQVVRSFPEEGQEPIKHCQSVAYSPDGKLLAAAGGGRVVYVWEVATGRLLFQLPGHPWTVSALAFSGDSRRLASGTGGISRPTDKIPRGANKKMIGDVKVWDLATGAELFGLKMERGRGLALSPDGKILFTSTYDGILAYDVSSGKKVFPAGRSLEGEFFALSPDGKRLAFGRRFAEHVKVADAQTGEEILTIGRMFGGVAGVAFSPDGNKIVATSGFGEVRVWDATPLK